MALKRLTAPVVSLMLVAVLFLAAGAQAADWPQWRHDAARTASTAEELPAHLELLWTRTLPPPQPAQPRDTRLCYDLTYQPVAAEGLVFVPSMVEDSVSAYDEATGALRWRYVASGPVRFAPCYYAGRLYFASDDGFLYCLEARSGRKLWRLRVAAADRRGPMLIGDGRLVSRWPCRAGPVVAGGVVYCAAGMFPFESVFVVAADARTGKVLWRNTDCSLIKNALLDHNFRAETGIVPEGYLAVLRDRLVVPCGRALPAFFDRGTGRLDPYTTGWGGRVGLAKGSWWVCGTGKLWFHSGEVFGLTPDAAAFAGPRPDFRDMTPEQFSAAARVPLKTVRQWIADGSLKTVERAGKTYIDASMPKSWTYLTWWSQPARPNEAWVLKHHPRFQIEPTNFGELGFFREPILDGKMMYYSVAAGATRRRGAFKTLPKAFTEVVAADLTSAKWRLTIHGRPDGRKTLVPWPTLEFRRLWSLPCNLRVQIKAGRRLYGSARGLVAAIDLPGGSRPARVSWRAQVQGTPEAMLAADGRLIVVTREGRLYCFGRRPPGSKPRVWPRPQPAPVGKPWQSRARAILAVTDAEGGFCLVLGYGSGQLARAIAQASHMRVVVLEPDANTVARARDALAAAGIPACRIHVIAGNIYTADLPPFFARLVVSENWAAAISAKPRTFIARLARLLRPYGGAACIPAGDAAASALSGAGRALNDHGLALSRRGRLLVIARPSALPGAADWDHEAADAANTYASRDRAVRPPFAVLWFGGGVDTIFPPWDFTHFRGPFPLICAGRMFILVENRVNAVDIYTGRLLWSRTMPPGARGTRNIFHRPTGENIAATADSVYVNVEGTIFRLDASTGRPLTRIPGPAGRPWQQFRVSGDALLAAAGGRLACLHRRDGAVRWQRDFPEDRVAIAVGKGMVFCAGWWSSARLRRGERIPAAVPLRALDLRTGRLLWAAKVAPAPGEAPGSGGAYRPIAPNVQYCPEADVVVVTSPRRIAAAFRGKTGQKLWGTDVAGAKLPAELFDPEPPMVLPTVLLTNRRRLILDILTGRPPAKPLSAGLKLTWARPGQRGCNRAVCGLAIISLRDADASFVDISTGRRVYMYGFRAGCTNSIIPADGVLNVPHYAHGCTCNAYPVFASVALVHYPAAEAWRPRTICDPAAGR